MKVIITENPVVEMLLIEKDNGKCVFHGNYWDFSRDGKSLKKLFEALDLEVRLIQTEDDLT